MEIISAQKFTAELNPGGSDPLVCQRVADIIERIRKGGERALLDVIEEVEGYRGDRVIAGPADMEQAYQELEPSLKDSLIWMWTQVTAFHRSEPLPSEWEAKGVQGSYGQRVLPVDSCGVYVPGGKYPYPSSLIMAAAPARVAGVKNLLVASPPGDTGLPHPVILAAAHLAGCQLALGAGGAAGLAALALGVSVPRVDLLVGPGGPYVQEAKRQLLGLVGIDILAGPSELAVVAEEGHADPGLIALDLLAQLEHGPGGRLFVFTPSAGLAREIRAEMKRIISTSPLGPVLESYLEESIARAVVTDSMAQAVSLAGRAEPEHVLLAVARPRIWLERLEGGAAVYLGQATPPAMGDYGSGPTHILPTGGASAFSSGLGTETFLRRQNFFEARRPPSRFSRRVSEAEGLHFHTRSMEIRGREMVKLDANEMTQAGPGPVLLRAQNEAGRSWNRYPPTQSDRLTDLLAQYAGVSPSQVLIGAGADELILSLSLAFRDLEWLLPWPDFGVYREVMEWGRISHRLVPLEEGFGFPADRLENLLKDASQGSTVAMLSRPHNPTGQLWSPDYLERLLDLGSWLVVDEAYQEFAGSSLSSWLTDRSRLIIVRTLSKAFGLAGLRVGYLLASPEVIARVSARRLPFSVSGPSQRGAEVFLEARDQVLEAATGVRQRREVLREQLARQGLEALPSEANFLLVHVEDGPGVRDALLERGYQVRSFPDQDALKPYVRVTVGETEENNGLLWELGQLMKGREIT